MILFDYHLTLSIFAAVLCVIGIISLIVIYNVSFKGEDLMKKRIKRIYALYIGDVNVMDGTKDELAEYLHVKPETISFYLSPSHKNKRCNCNKSPIVVYVGKERM